jgi:hypothetical protein
MRQYSIGASYNYAFVLLSFPRTWKPYRLEPVSTCTLQDSICARSYDLTLCFREASVWLLPELTSGLI